jgi:hypothetical protein
MLKIIFLSLLVTLVAYYGISVQTTRNVNLGYARIPVIPKVSAHLLLCEYRLNRVYPLEVSLEVSL